MQSSSERIADALWDGVRHEPPMAHGSAGLRSWYLSRVYQPVVRRRRRRIWAHRSPEPWLTAQWLMERGAGQQTDREFLRYEGLPGQHSYDDAYEAVRRGQFAPPLIFVAGYSRSGTTSMQNLVMRAFPAHLPPGRWSDPGHPMRLWWYPKHRADIARRIAETEPDDARVVVCIRPFVDAAASLAIYSGRIEAGAITTEWVQSQMTDWTRMARVCDIAGTVTVPFAAFSSAPPRSLAASLGQRLGIVGTLPTADTTWAEVYAGGISPEVLDDPRLSNLPHAERRPIVGEVRSAILDRLGSERDAVETAYERALAVGNLD